MLHAFPVSLPAPLTGLGSLSLLSPCSCWSPVCPRHPGRPACYSKRSHRPHHMRFPQQPQAATSQPCEPRDARREGRRSRSSLAAGRVVPWQGHPKSTVARPWPPPARCVSLLHEMLSTFSLLALAFALALALVLRFHCPAQPLYGGPQSAFRARRPCLRSFLPLPRSPIPTVPLWRNGCCPTPPQAPDVSGAHPPDPQPSVPQTRTFKQSFDRLPVRGLRACTTPRRRALAAGAGRERRPQSRRRLLPRAPPGPRQPPVFACGARVSLPMPASNAPLRLS